MIWVGGYSMAKKKLIIIGFLLCILCICIGVAIMEYAINFEIEAYATPKTDIKIFKDTDAWELAKAVEAQDVKKIEKIAKDNPELLNYQDPYYQVTLLMWAVGMEKYESAEALLERGADPNIIADGTELYETIAEEALANEQLEWFTDAPKPFQGATALYIASGYSWIDREAKKDPKFVTLLLEYEADPNICHTAGIKYTDYPGAQRFLYGAEAGLSPLINSIGCGIEKTKALVDAGADINSKTESGNTAAIEALEVDGIPEYAYYLIVEKEAVVSEPYYTARYLSLASPNFDVKTHYPVNLLRNWLPELDSEEYTMKMEIVDEFMREGVDYWETEIPNDVLQQIKKLHPDSWEYYIQNY